MDELEFLEYLNLIDGIEARSVELGEPLLVDAIYDEDGAVPGCFRTSPASFED